MRAFITGATGFIGGHTADALVRAGWEVTGLVRDPARASRLADRGVALVPGDVTDPSSFATAMKGFDAVLHLAAWYSLGVRDRAAMERINVRGTEDVLRAAADAGVPRILYCSSAAAIGTQPHGTVADETTPHLKRFGSVYEETKYRAHLRAHALVAEGAPIISVMPCAVYGVGDVSLLGTLFRLYARKLLLALPFREVGVSWVHVDDVAEGIVRALADAPAGEDYVLGGDNETIGGLIRRIEPLTGIRRPLFGVPRPLMRLSLPLDPIVAAMLGQSRGVLRDGYNSLNGSLMLSSAKAMRDFGYSYRSIEEGIPPMIAELRAAR